MNYYLTPQLKTLLEPVVTTVIFNFNALAYPYKVLLVVVAAAIVLLLVVTVYEYVLDKIEAFIRQREDDSIRPEVRTYAIEFIKNVTTNATCLLDKRNNSLSLETMNASFTAPHEGNPQAVFTRNGERLVAETTSEEVYLDLLAGYLCSEMLKQVEHQKYQNSLKTFEAERNNIIRKLEEFNGW